MWVHIHVYRPTTEMRKTHRSGYVSTSKDAAVSEQRTTPRVLLLLINRTRNARGYPCFSYTHTHTTSCRGDHAVFIFKNKVNSKYCAPVVQSPPYATPRSTYRVFARRDRRASGRPCPFVESAGRSRTTAAAANGLRAVARCQSRFAYYANRTSQWRHADGRQEHGKENEKKKTNPHNGTPACDDRTRTGIITQRSARGLSF